MLIYAETFKAKSVLSIAAGLDGDFSKITVRGRVSASAAGGAVRLCTSNDGGANVKTADYGLQSEGVWGVADGASIVRQNVSGICLAANVIADREWQFEVEICNINDGYPDREKMGWARVSGPANPSSPFYYSRHDRYFFVHDMINALWVGPASGTISGHIEVYGEPRVDVHPKPTNLYKIAGFGPSTTITGGWLEAAEGQLQTAFPAKRILCRNFGRNSMGSGDALRNMGSVIAAKPDAVVLDFALADGFHFDVNGAASEAQHRTMFSRFLTALPDLKIYLLTSSPFYGQAAIDYPSLPQAYQMYRNLAAEFGFTLVDSYPLWPATNPSGNLTKNGDGVHATPAANATYLVPSLVTALSAGIV